MSNYDNNNTGALFKNDKKTPTHPDYNGTCEINGVEMWISAWLKRSAAGNTFMSLSFNPKEVQANKSQPSTIVPSAGDGFDDDIPF